MYQLNKHIVQSEYWQKIKDLTGTKVINVNGLVCTLNKIPFLNCYIAYVPKISNSEINFKELRNIAKENNVIAYRFDVPFVLKDLNNKSYLEFDKFMQKNFVKSPTDTF